MLYPAYAYENTHRVVYDGGAQFVRVCPRCGRFVKADKKIRVNGAEDLVEEPNATCSKCGRVEMPFEGWI